MSDNDPLPVEVYAPATQNLDDILVRQSMEAVATNAGLAQGPRQCKQSREARQRVMKRGIETGDLGKIRLHRSDSGYAREIMGLMQRRQRHKLAQTILEGGCDANGTVAVLTTMDDAMSNGIQPHAAKLFADMLQDG